MSLLCFQRYRNILVFDCCAKSASLDQVAARYFDNRGKFKSCLVLARGMDETSVVGASLDVHTSAWALLQNTNNLEVEHEDEDLANDEQVSFAFLSLTQGLGDGCVGQEHTHEQDKDKWTDKETIDKHKGR